jgi:L-ascorbate metabolism protein UlaG (beta-lactamase superfamily)
VKPIRLTWVGHSSVLVDTGDSQIITDPLLTRRVAHLRRRTPIPTLDPLDVDLVLLSHAHADHVHGRSLAKFGGQASAIASRGLGALAQKAGFNEIIECDTGDQIPFGDTHIEVVHAEHKDGRGPHSRVRAKPVGFVINAAGQRIYYPGDTDLFSEMSSIGPVDVAVLPIWGWGPTLGTGHLDPTRAAQAAALLKPRVVIPIHWGTYAPEDLRRHPPRWLERPLEDFTTQLQRLGLSDRLHVLRPGQTTVVSQPKVHAS